ncbi:unnamed protein product [Parascedosporium putredinis]|uniref:Uncharacterized protein n=1 Tax=Parascedosporium putredinis TaxID=1442378 RepID=A0A9P1GXZ1_9PEZI|nr:unnamed protein product [Parascedosporium putredinis]CAI7989465.1 unnamed protein product [Parascedosporium putredinis]
MPSTYRQKTTSITLKVINRRAPAARPPTPDLSGDEGYSALEDLSDTDDEDEENPPLPRPMSSDEEYADEEEQDEQDDQDEEEEVEEPIDDDDDGYVEDDEEDENAVDDEDEDNDLLLRDETKVEGGDVDESASWNGVSTDDSDAEGGLDSAFAAIHRQGGQAERHVRFANVPDSDSDSTDTDEDHADMFPDIFVDQSTLDPAIRREIDRDPDESSGSGGSFWDIHGTYDYSTADSDGEVYRARPADAENTPMATPIAALPLVPQLDLASVMSTPTRAVELAVDLDGYETDGDTTEEDIPEPIVRKKSRRPDPVDDDSDSDCTPVKSKKGKPRVGRFNLDKSDKKPIAVLNPITKKMMIFTPHKHRQLDLSPEQFNFSFFSHAEMSSPAVNNASTFMLNAMFSSGTFGDFVNGHGITDVDALLQSALLSEANTIDDSLDSDLGLDGDDGEKALDINDFITFAAGGVSDSEMDQDWHTDINSTPGGPGATSDVDMLSHVSSATVGAFRQNQITQQLILSNKASQDSLAFSGPFNDTALRGLKSDRLATAAVPLTPVRRRRKSSIHEPLPEAQYRRIGIIPGLEENRRE